MQNMQSGGSRGPGWRTADLEDSEVTHESDWGQDLDLNLSVVTQRCFTAPQFWWTISKPGLNNTAFQVFHQASHYFHMPPPFFLES